MFILASHQLKNHPRNQDQVRGWKLADQAYWILLFLFGFSKLPLTEKQVGDVQNIRVNFLTCCHSSNCNIYSGTAAALLVNLVIFLLLPLSRFGLPFRNTAAHKTHKWEDHRSPCSWVSCAEMFAECWVHGLKVQTWNPSSSQQLRLSFETFRLS